eukprot:355489-Chlamydomonas_euryale.AAC.9
MSHQFAQVEDLDLALRKKDLQSATTKLTAVQTALDQVIASVLCRDELRGNPVSRSPASLMDFACGRLANCGFEPDQSRQEYAGWWQIGSPCVKWANALGAMHGHCGFVSRNSSAYCIHDVIQSVSVILVSLPVDVNNRRVFSSPVLASCAVSSPPPGHMITCTNED